MRVFIWKPPNVLCEGGRYTGACITRKEYRFFRSFLCFWLVIIFSEGQGRLRKYHTRLNWACRRTRYEKKIDLKQELQTGRDRKSVV